MFQKKCLECYRTLRAIGGNRDFNSVYFRFFYLRKFFYPAADIRQISTPRQCMIAMRGRQVVIYGEYLFTENFITGGILLFSTGKLLRCKLSGIRLVIGAGVCGAAGFVIFIPTSPPAGVLLRIGIAAVAVLSALGGAKTPKDLLVKTSIFMALTFVSGGMVMALMLWQEVPSISGAGAMYIPPMTYLRLLCFGTLSFGFSYLLLRLIRRVRLDMGLCDRAEVKIGGKKVFLKAMVDTGNYLKEPYSGKPVALVARTAAKSFGELADFAEPSKLAGLEDPEKFSSGGRGSIVSPESIDCRRRYTLIPFRAVGSQNGILEGIRTDYIFFRGNQIENAVIAFYDGDFEESDIILGRDFLDRGLSDD